MPVTVVAVINVIKKMFLEIASEQSNFGIINNTLYILSNNAIVLYSKHSSLVDY